MIVTPDELPDPHQLPIRLRLNGQTMQDSNTSQMIFNVGAVVAYISQVFTIEPGDLRQPYVFSHLHFLTLTGFAALLLRITSDKEWLRSAFHEQVIAAAKAGMGSGPSEGTIRVHLCAAGAR